MFNAVFQLAFRIHDAVCDFLATHLERVKIILLLVAHLCLFGLFFPALRIEFGEMARNLLLFLLFLSPVSKIFRMRLLILLMSLRRQMGITFAYLATVHTLGYVFEVIPPVLSGEVMSDIFLHPETWQPKLVLGTAAYVLTLPLLFTSNNLAQRLLKTHWKQLHRIVYGVLVLVLIHSVLALGWEWMMAEPSKALLWFGVLAVYVWLKWLAARPLFPLFLERIISLVSTRYAAYREEIVAVSRPAGIL